MLAKSYDHLGKGAAAREAYSNAAALGVTDAALAEKLDREIPVAEASGDAVISGIVTVADSVTARINGNETVFITAKPADGSPMPLAVLRRSARDLPIEFTLDNGSSMIAGAGLSPGENVIVTAKISKSGDALVTDSDLVASSGPIDPAGHSGLELVIGPSTSAGPGNGR